MAEFTDPVQCEWFANCHRPAAGDGPHPVLGMVPVCTECSDRFQIPLIKYQEN